MVSKLHLVFILTFVRGVYHENKKSRVPFGDWYDTVTGKYEHFIGRSVQGGIYMPIFRKYMEKISDCPQKCEKAKKENGNDFRKKIEEKTSKRYNEDNCWKKLSDLY